MSVEFIPRIRPEEMLSRLANEAERVLAVRPEMAAVMSEFIKKSLSLRGVLERSNLGLDELCCVIRDFMDSSLERWNEARCKVGLRECGLTRLRKDMSEEPEVADCLLTRYIRVVLLNLSERTSEVSLRRLASGEVLGLTVATEVILTIASSTFALGQDGDSCGSGSGDPLQPAYATVTVRS